MKHTAGPWRLGWPSGSLESDSLRKTGDGVPYRVYHTVNGVQRNGKYAKGVAHVYLGEYEEGKLFEKTKPMLEEQLANALLITAAPDLLEACKLAANRYYGEWGIDNDPMPEMRHIGDVHPGKKILAAITKAETIPKGVKIS